MKVAALLLLLISNAAFADDTAMLRCRELSDPSLRLACYDSVTIPASEGPAPLAEPRQKLDQFGMDRQVPKSELQAIVSHIEGRFDGWGPKEKIQFANGQVWQISDDSRAVLNVSSPRVRVHRGLLGSYFLEIEGTSHSPRVKRVR